MINVLATEISRNPKLAQCDKQSVVLAALRCARYNLEPGEGLACLIPRGGQCDFQLEYRGMLLLMHRTGQLRDIRCEVVRENDPVWEFELGSQYESGYHLRHQRLWGGDRGRMIAVYAVARLTNGGEYPLAMDRREVEHIRDEASQNTGPNSPWRKWEPAMWRKTCLKQLLKVCPLSADIVSADRVDDLSMVGVDQPAPAGVGPAEVAEMVEPVVADEAEIVEDFIEERLEQPVRKRKKSTKNIEKDAYLEVALALKGWDRALALKKAQGLMQKDTVRLTAEDWAYCQQGIRDTSEEPLPDKPVDAAASFPVEDKFKPGGGQAFVPPSGKVEEPAF